MTEISFSFFFCHLFREKRSVLEIIPVLNRPVYGIFESKMIGAEFEIAKKQVYNCEKTILRLINITSQYQISLYFCVIKLSEGQFENKSNTQTKKNKTL